MKNYNDVLLEALIRAAGSNLRMVRPILVSAVKLLINRARSARRNLKLAIFSSQEALSLHFSFKLGVRKGNDTGAEVLQVGLEV